MVDIAKGDNYSSNMVEIVSSETFDAWLAGLREAQTRARINARIRRLSVGNPGQHRVLTGGVVEMKIDFGPGYRVYFMQRGTFLVVLLCGGDKSSQDADIKTAKRIAKDWKE